MQHLLEPFIEKLNKIYPMSIELKDNLLRHTIIKKISKGDIILQEGQISNHVTAVLKGLLRSYYYLHEQEEITSRFTPEGDFVLSVNSFYSRKQGYEYLVADEESIIAQITYEQQQQYLKTYLEYNMIVRYFTEKYYAASEEHLFNLRKQTAEEKWIYFVNTYPQLVQRVPLKHIATFLGMNMETLSRVRMKKH